MQIDTTLHVFMLAMLLHPDAQQKAQAELDTVIGNGRLPTCTDRDSLPYVNALVLEIMRWHSAVPSGERCSYSLYKALIIGLHGRGGAFQYRRYCLQRVFYPKGVHHHP